MLLAGLQPGNKTKTFNSMLKTTTILPFSHKRRGVLDSPASRVPRVPSGDLKWAGSSGLAPGHQALLPTSSLPAPTVPTHSSVMTSPPQGTGYADELCGQPRACPAFHWPPHCPGPTGQPSSEHSGFIKSMWENQCSLRKWRAELELMGLLLG